jgi:ribosomal subunit interface protein
MASDPNVVVHFKDVSVDEDVREYVRERCAHLATEFPEATHFELTLEPDARSVQCHGHVTGKRTRVAAHAGGAALLRQAADAALDKLERELRKEHDKRIFAQRRKAQKTRGKRVS